MSSQAQLTGKQQSSQNAVKHGFSSKAFLIPDGEQEDFNHFRTRLENVY